MTGRGSRPSAARRASQPNRGPKPDRGIPRMPIHDRSIKRDAHVAEKELAIQLITATGQTAVKALGFTPGHAFQIVKVKTWCSVVTATATADVKIGGTSALNAAATFTANTE